MSTSTSSEINFRNSLSKLNVIDIDDEKDNKNRHPLPIPSKTPNQNPNPNPHPKRESPPPSVSTSSSTSASSTMLVSDEAEEAAAEKYWTDTFFFTFCPFTLIGVPVHDLIFGGPKKPSTKNYAKFGAVNRGEEEEEVESYAPNSDSNYNSDLTSSSSSRSSSSNLVSSSPSSRSGKARETQLFLGENPDPGSNTKSQSAECTSLCSLAKALLPLISLPVLIAVLYAGASLFINLIVHGRIAGHFICTLQNFISLAPLAGLPIFIWTAGFSSFQSLIHGLSNKDESMKIPIKMPGSPSSPPEKSNSSSKIKGKPEENSTPPISGARTNILLMYVIIFVVSLVNFMINWHWTRADLNWSWEEILSHWVNFISRLFHCLLLPLYCCFCGALLFQLENLGSFIQSLAGKRGRRNSGSNSSSSSSTSSSSSPDRSSGPISMDVEDLTRIHDTYKLIAERILAVNSVWSAYVSWIFIQLVLSIVLESRSIIVNNFLGALLHLIEGNSFVFNQAVYRVASGSTISIGLNRGGGGGGSVGGSFVPSDHVVRDTVEGFVVTPAVLRTIIGVVIIISLYTLLVVLSVMQVVRVNDESRFLMVSINDLAFRLQAQRNYVQQTEHLQFWSAFHRLKDYIHSRMEQSNPALLSISILTPLPFVGQRIVGYHVRH